MHLIGDEIERITGYPPTDFVENRVRAYMSLIHHDDRERVERDVWAAVEAGRQFQLEYRGEKGPPFPQLYVDPDTLRQRATRAGWLLEVLQTAGRGAYLEDLSDPVQESDVCPCQLGCRSATTMVGQTLTPPWSGRSTRR